jgi:heme exporter protein D
VNYLPYVIAAYAVFAAVMLWDYLVPRLQLRRQLRDARLRGARRRNRQAPPAPGTSLARD